MRNLHALIDSLNNAGIITCWARELRDPTAGALWIAEYGVLVLNAAASILLQVESCQELLSLVSAKEAA